MTKSPILPSLQDLKQAAKILRAEQCAANNAITHSQALERVAHRYGYKDWNALHAAVEASPICPVTVGQSVQGAYLSQNFTARVYHVQALERSGFFRVTFIFDEPVDVVTFDSFSAFRKRVTCVIGTNGKTLEKTSNGQPHLCLHALAS